MINFLRSKCLYSTEPYTYSYTWNRIPGNPHLIENLKAKVLNNSSSQLLKEKTNKQTNKQTKNKNKKQKQKQKQKKLN